MKIVIPPNLWHAFKDPIRIYGYAASIVRYPWGGPIIRLAFHASRTHRDHYVLTDRQAIQLSGRAWRAK